VQSRRAGVFARRWGGGFEALYVGKANNIRARVKQQLNNVRLMQHLKDARNGSRVVLAGEFVAHGRQSLPACLPLIEKALSGVGSADVVYERRSEGR